MNTLIRLSKIIIKFNKIQKYLKMKNNLITQICNFMNQKMYHQKLIINNNKMTIVLIIQMKNYSI